MEYEIYEKQNKNLLKRKIYHKTISELMNQVWKPQNHKSFLKKLTLTRWIKKRTEFRLSYNFKAVFMLYNYNYIRRKNSPFLKVWLLLFCMLRRLSPQEIKIFGRGNQKLHLFKPEFQSVLYNTLNQFPLLII